jgi:two-component system, NtrC family, sensor kinase
MGGWQTRLWRYRILLLTGVAFLGAIGGWYVIASAILLNSFERVEEQRVKQDIQRTLSMASYELSGLLSKLRDYAIWDDSYAFSEGKNPEYIGESITPGTFSDNKISFIAVVTKTGKLQYSGLFDPNQQHLVELPSSLEDQLTTHLPRLLSNSSQTKQSRTGFLVVPEGLLLLACHPILRTDATGIVKSYMVFGRYLDPVKIAELNQVTKLNIKVYANRTADLPPDLQAATQQLSPGQRIVVKPLKDNLIAGYTRIEDIYRQPTILLKVTTSRAIYQQGLLSTRYLALSLLGVGTLAAGVIGLLLRKLISNLRDRDRLEQSLLQETQLRKSEEKYRQKAQELEQALHQLQQAQAQLVQSEKMSSLGQLVAGIAHEINNPVSFIYGNLKPLGLAIQDLFQLIDLYRKHYPTPAIEIKVKEKTIELPYLKTDLPKLLKSMGNGAERIQQIVLSLRNFSRLDESSMKFVDIHEGIDNALFILQSRTSAQGSFPGIEVIKDYGDLPQVECYAGQLNQVFMNILTNGIEALEEIWNEAPAPSSQLPHPQVCISTRCLDQQVRIQISNNGPTISEEVREKLFDPFFTTKPVGQGTGLGLAISYKIVAEKHHGLLTCPAIEKGAAFTIQIPIAQTVQLKTADAFLMSDASL